MGQAKWVPGQISFMTTPTGRLPSVQPLVEAGLPIAPYIEHGSYDMGYPAIMRYGRDPYRGLGVGPLTEAACSETEFAQAWRERLNAGLNTAAVAAVIGGAAAGVIGAITGRMVVGAIFGAAIGYTANAVWTAPDRV
jgi:hypothetical protein